MIEQVQRPTLIIEPNKSLAAQLSSELRDLFPKNRVEFFVSYYDYYQPEAYLPTTDTYIEKDSSINDEIDRLRHATTSSLLMRKDVIVVASVSCIYGLGSPSEYRDRILGLKVGDQYDQRDILRKLVDLQYARNDVNLVRGTFRARGDTVEIHPAYEEQALRVELFGDTIDRIVPFDVMTGEMGDELEDIAVYAATHYVTGDEIVQRAIGTIETELRECLQYFEKEGKLLEAQRLRVRTEHDLEMLAETGICSGIENYSRHLDGRAPGETPFTLLDFFPKDYLVVIDESHVAVPQLHGQWAGDRSRKDMLVEHGFRLPSARDNRPLRFDEFIERVPQAIFVSATPGPFESEHSTQMVEQVIRPTGLVDPEVTIRPTKGQVDDLLARIGTTVAAGGRVLVTTLTKKMAEDLTEYLADAGVRVQYLHSDIDTITRIEILRELRLGSIDVLVGINLLREGPRPARGGPGGHPRRRQGGLPAVGLLAHPDHGPGGAQRGRDGGALRRHHHRLHARGRLGDPAPPRDPDGLQPRARDRPDDDPQDGDRHPRAAPGEQRGDRSLHQRRAQPGRGATQRRRTWQQAVVAGRRRCVHAGRGGRADDPARGRNEVGRRRPALRGGRAPAGRDRRAARLRPELIRSGVIQPPGILI